MAGAPKLIVLSEQFRGKVFELTKDTYSIGRVDARAYKFLEIYIILLLLPELPRLLPLQSLLQLLRYVEL